MAFINCEKDVKRKIRSIGKSESENGDMSWTDEEIDKLFNESANAQSFKYDDAYFSEIEAALPINKKGKDFLWMGTAMLFIVALTTGYFVTNSNENALNSYNDQLANLELNTENNRNIGNTVNSKSTTGENKSSANSSTAQQLKNQLNADSENDNLTIDRTANIEGNARLTYLSNLINTNTSRSDKNTPNGMSSGKLIPLTFTERVDPANYMPANNYTPLETFGKPTIVDVVIPNELPLTLTDLSTDLTFSSLETKSINQMDQNLDRSLMQSGLPLLSQIRPKASFYVELNGGISQSFIASSNTTNSSFGGGIGVESYFGNFNLTTGFNFKFSDVNDLSYSGSGIKYGFGSVLRSGNVNYEKMYSIEIPISLGYNFGKHNLNVGVRPSIVIGAKYQESAFENEQLTRREETIGFTDGLKRLGVKPTIGYAYHMNKWTIGGSIGVQLLQTVNDAKMNGTNNLSPIDGQVYLRRTIRLR
jgi:hypothetical protein